MNCAFNGNSAQVGGAIFAQFQSNITLIDSTVEGNSAQWFGGAIFAELHSNIIIINSQISENNIIQTHASHECFYSGAALYLSHGCNGRIRKSSFERNSVARSAGVVACGDDLILEITDSEFADNFGTYHGAVIDLSKTINVNLNILNSTFHDDTVNGRAIKVFQSDATHIAINNSSFVNNSAQYGGVLYMQSSRNITISISHSELIKNTANFSGGVIYATYIQDIHISIINSHLESNRAKRGNGGVIIAYYAKNSSITLESSDFSNNMAELIGGVIVTVNMSIVIIDSKFTENTAVRAGVIESYYGNYHDDKLIIVRSTFQSNSAIDDGGVIVLMHSIADIVASTFVNNMAYNNGGIVTATGGDIEIRNCKHYKNSAVMGAAIWAKDSNIGIYGSTFMDNSADIDGGTLYTLHAKTKIVGGSFSHNCAENNGGVMNSRGGMTTIIDTAFHDNSADNWYGGIVNAIGGDIEIRNCKHYNNSAMFGGAIRAENSNISIYRSAFMDNSAGIDGGTLYTLQVKTTIVGGSFSHNRAENNGGVMNSRGGMTTIIDTAFHKNSADNDGGIMRSYSSEVEVYHSSFISNWAEKQAGVFHMDQSNLTINESAFMRNKAHAGGIFLIEQGTLTVTQSFVSNNTAHTGGIMQTNQATLNIATTNITHNTGTVSTVYLMETKTLWSGVLFSSNEGTILAFGGSVTISSCTLIRNKQPTQWTKIQKLQEGGAMTVFQSDLIFNGICELKNNEAEDGGAIKAIESRIQVHGNVVLKSNIASKTGGGMYLFFSELTCEDNSTMRLISNSASSRGGGIHAIASSIKVKESSIRRHSTLQFVQNTAQKGGGLRIVRNSKLYIIKSQPEIAAHSKSITFTANSGEFGGAIYASDDGKCSLTRNSTKDECFLQTLAMYSAMEINPVSHQMSHRNIFFFNNTAEVSGHSLFGGSLDSCKVNPFSESNLDTISKDNNDDTLIEKGYEYIKDISNIRE